VYLELVSLAKVVDLALCTVFLTLGGTGYTSGVISEYTGVSMESNISGVYG
jgi:molybdopterin biosynthesis enzyme MoaB